MNQTTLPPEEERFSITAVQLAGAIKYCVNDLISKGYNTVNPLLVELASTVIMNFDKHQLIQGFIENSHISCWDNIKMRNEEFFVNNSGEIFKHLPAGEVNLFKDLFTTKDQNGNSVVEQSFKNQVWTLFDAMVKISIKYIHKNRSPYSTNENGVVVNKYERSFFNNIDIQSHSDKWKVVLTFEPRI
jgi:hypothetical protein